MKKGFTLVELLVVIALIGLLSSIALISFTGVQKQSRDVQRKSDIKQYQLALESFANKNSGLYPQRMTTADLSYLANPLCTYLSMTSCPTDPREPKDNTFIYHYQSDGSLSDGTVGATKYVLWGKVENVSTVTYWIVCSNGKSSQTATGIPPTGGVCPI
jgi:prepilin-type N-terminal cleavage/methylation domain-containing protein